MNQNGYVTILKHLSTTVISFISGFVLAIVVNYLSGSDTGSDFFIIISGAVLLIAAWYLWTLRNKTDQQYLSLLTVPSSTMATAWRLACNPTQPGRVAVFFVALILFFGSMLACLFFVINDAFWGMPKYSPESQLISIESKIKGLENSVHYLQEKSQSDSFFQVSVNQQLDSLQNKKCCK